MDSWSCKNPKIKKYNIISTEEDLKSLCKKMMKLEAFAFDTETNTLRVYGPFSDFSLVGISISWGAYNNYYIPLGHLRDEDYFKQLPLNLVVRYLSVVFARTDVIVIGQNLKFDLHALSRVGIKVASRKLYDTMIMSWLCDENTPNGLKENTKLLLQVSQTHFKEVTENVPVEVRKQYGFKANSKVPFSLVLIDEGAPYALDDAFYTFILCIVFLDKLEEEKMFKIYEKVYMPFIKTLFDMEEHGVTVDIEKLDKMSVEINKDIQELAYKIYEYVGVEFNISSSPQLAELLFGYQSQSKELDISKQSKIVQKMFSERDEEGLSARGMYISEIDRARWGLFKRTGVPALQKASFNFKVISTTEKGAPQCNNDVFWKLSKMQFTNPRKQAGVEVCKLLLEYKKLDKLKSAFIDGLKEQLYDDGKMHPSFNIIGTDSGRISCSDPNLQQLPKAGEEDKYQIRSLFIGSVDEVTGKRKHIVAIDFSNLEMRVLAHFSEDEKLIAMFNNNEDSHGSTAVNMFELDCTPEEVKKKYPHLRQAAKVINFIDQVA